MKTLFPLFLLLLSLFCGCGELELPTDADGADNDGGQNGTEAPVPTAPGDTLSVEAFRTACDEGEVAWVKGYIVGYVDGNSLASSVFSLPTEKANSNMLLALTPYEDDPARCLPVKLEATTSYATRAELNLLDHPEHLQRPIVLLALRGTYFRTAGAVRIYNYRWSVGDVEMEKATPEILHEPCFIPEGR